MPTYLETYNASKDADLTARFESALGETSQAVVSGVVPKPGTTEKKKYDVCRAIQRNAGYRNDSARTFLLKGLDKKELTITQVNNPPAYDATDAEIQSSVLANINDPAFLDLLQTSGN